MKRILNITMCFLLLVGMICCTKEDDSKEESKGNGRTEEQVNDSISNEKEKELGKETVVKLDSPGMLSKEITPDKKYTITNLKIVGAINGSDISFLRDMAKTEPSGGVMSALDLSDCYIVKGGDCYYEEANTKYYTEDNIIGDNMFSGCDVLKYFTMPPKVSGIGKNAFKKSGITSITIPNTIQSVGECAFEGCI